MLIHLCPKSDIWHGRNPYRITRLDLILVSVIYWPRTLGKFFKLVIIFFTYKINTNTATASIPVHIFKKT